MNIHIFKENKTNETIVAVNTMQYVKLNQSLHFKK
jgi:hypothetical protein